MASTNTFRLICSDPLPGARNMAIDEALLEGMEAAETMPVLRFYRWQPPALSLGFAQPYGDVDEHGLASRGWQVVRRPTGGRAILHTDELTYSLILPLSHPLAAGGVMASYQRLSEALLSGLRTLGLSVEIEKQASGTSTDRSNPVCFEVPSAYELTVQGKKLIGSAQLRRRRSMLQHGSLPLKGDLGRICDALAFENPQARRKARRRLTQRAGTIESLTGQVVSWQQAQQALQGAFVQTFDITFEKSELNGIETHRADRLAEQRYSQSEWTKRM